MEMFVSLNKSGIRWSSEETEESNVKENKKIK